MKLTRDILIGDASIKGSPYLSSLLDRAIEKSGGVRALERAIGWNIGSMGKVRSGTERLSAYRAAQLADLVGDDPTTAVFAALEAGSKSEPEKNYWQRFRV